MSDDDRSYAVAVHEAAHAVVSYRTSGHVRGDISIVPRRDWLGIVSGQIDRDDPAAVDATILELYAGEYAQRRLAPAVEDAGGEDDQAKALDLLGEAVTGGRLERELRERSRALVELHWPEILAVADELMRARALDGVEVGLIADFAAGLNEVTEDHLRYYRANHPRPRTD